MEIITYRLKIKKQDDSIYWTEHFNSLESLNIWLSEEMTRPYWDQTWYSEVYELDNQGTETLVEE